MTISLAQRAAAVNATRPDHRMSPRAAARCLSGVINLVSRQWSNDVMRMVCAELADDEAAWESPIQGLPRTTTPVHPALEMIAVVARGIVPLAGVGAMRAALAYWATERDPREWQKLTQGLAA